MYNLVCFGQTFFSKWSKKVLYTFIGGFGDHIGRINSPLNLAKTQICPEPRTG